MEKKKIVILGAGFGGIYTYLNLKKTLDMRKAHVTIVNRTNYFLFTPLLHEVATGSLSHHQIVEAVREITYDKKTSFVLADIKSVSLSKKIVETSEGEVPYDILVIALGSTTQFHNTPGAEEHSLVLKDLYDAIKLRNHFIQTFEKASRVKDKVERQKMLSFAIVGGGPTGVELAAEVSELFLETFKKYYPTEIPCDDISIYLFSSNKELLSMYHPLLQKKAKKVLERKGVAVKLEMAVSFINSNGITLTDGSSVAIRNIIWVAGVKPNVPAFDMPVELSKNGGIVVDEFLRMKGYEDIYVLGDGATFIPKGTDRPVPMLAQVATQQAKTVANNILRKSMSKPLKPFKFFHIGDLVSLGQWHAVGDVLGIRWPGPIAWFIWRTTYLFKFASWTKRIKIMVDWTIDIFYPRDITKA